MLVECHRCLTVFTIDDALVGKEEVPVQCTRCGAVFRVGRPVPGIAPRQEVRPDRVECRRCGTRFRAELPGGTAVQCTRCGLVFKTPTKAVTDQVQFFEYVPGRAVLPVEPGKLHEPAVRQVEAQVEAVVLPEPGREHVLPRAAFTPIMAPGPLPDVLQEIGGQGSSDSHRRWFRSRSVELIIWLDQHDAPRAFRLCYDKDTRERAITWSEGKFAHALVDSGEQHHSGPSYKQGPMLLSDLEFDVEHVIAVFERVRGALPAELGRFVAEKLASRVAGVPLKPPSDSRN